MWHPHAKMTSKGVTGLERRTVVHASFFRLLHQVPKFVCEVVNIVIDRPACPPPLFAGSPPPPTIGLAVVAGIVRVPRGHPSLGEFDEIVETNHPCIAHVNHCHQGLELASSHCEIEVLEPTLESTLRDVVI